MDIGAEVRRIGNTVRWSWQGWCSTWAREKSLRQWTLVNVLSAGFAFLLPLTPGERALILALGLLVLVMELVNTAIEECVDLVTEEQDPRAGRAKDAGSAAVAVAAIAAGVAWAVLLVG
jgi:diacylglycerol kinase (ATP)